MTTPPTMKCMEIQLNQEEPSQIKECTEQMLVESRLKINRVGPRTDPWGTTGSVWDLAPLRLMYLVLPARYDVNQSKAVSESPTSKWRCLRRILIDGVRTVKKSQHYLNKQLPLVYEALYSLYMSFNTLFSCPACIFKAGSLFVLLFGFFSEESVTHSRLPAQDQTTG